MKYRYRFPLPPLLNHQYENNGRGGRVLTLEARRWREQAQLIAKGFSPALNRTYSVLLWVTFPTWSWDIDSVIKNTLDSTFGSRFDHRVTSLVVRKSVGADPHIGMLIVEHNAPPAHRGMQ